MAPMAMAYWSTLRHRLCWPNFLCRYRTINRKLPFPLSTVTSVSQVHPHGLVSVAQLSSDGVIGAVLAFTFGAVACTR